jgi:hypothetical protein
MLSCYAQPGKPVTSPPPRNVQPNSVSAQPPAHLGPCAAITLAAAPPRQARAGRSA